MGSGLGSSVADAMGMWAEDAMLAAEDATSLAGVGGSLSSVGGTVRGNVAADRPESTPQMIDNALLDSMDHLSEATFLMGGHDALAARDLSKAGGSKISSGLSVISGISTAYNHDPITGDPGSFRGMRESLAAGTMDALWGLEGGPLAIADVGLGLLNEHVLGGDGGAPIGGAIQAATQLSQIANPMDLAIDTIEESIENGELTLPDRGPQLAALDRRMRNGELGGAIEGWNKLGHHIADSLPSFNNDVDTGPRNTIGAGFLNGEISSAKWRARLARTDEERAEAEREIESLERVREENNRKILKNAGFNFGGD